MAYSFTDPAQFPYRPGCLFLGLDLKSGKEVGIKTEVHAITIGGSGAGKGSALLVQNARRWTGNLACIDPKGENAILSWEAREAMGQQVGVIDPFGQIPRGRVPARYQGHANPLPDRLRVSINPLAEIDPASPRAAATLTAIGSGMILSHDPKHMEWTVGARELLAGYCAHVVATRPLEERTFATVRELLMKSDEELYEYVQLHMIDDKRIGGLIRAAGRITMSALESQKDIEKDFFKQVRRATRWLDDEAISAVLNQSTFQLSALKTGNASLFIVLPAEYAQDYSVFLRLMVKAALDAIGGRSDTGTKECLLLLDEFYSLGKMEELSGGAGRLRDAGAHLWPFLQSLTQLETLYGDKIAKEFLTNAAAHVFLGNDQDDTALSFISYRLGATTADEISSAFSAPNSKHLDALAQAANRTYTPTRLDPKSKWNWLNDIGNAIGQASADADRAAFTNATRAHQEHVSNLRAQHDHAMAKVGTPRMTPQEIAALIGKDETGGDDLARSMIVFVPAGKVLNLKPAPYFKERARRAAVRSVAAPVQEPVAAEPLQTIEYISPLAGRCTIQNKMGDIFTKDRYQIRPDIIDRMREKIISHVKKYLKTTSIEEFVDAYDRWSIDVNKKDSIVLRHDIFAICHINKLERHDEYLNGKYFLWVWRNNKINEIMGWSALNYGHAVTFRPGALMHNGAGLSVEKHFELRECIERFCYKFTNEERHHVHRMPWVDWFPTLQIYSRPNRESWKPPYTLYIEPRSATYGIRRKFGLR